MSPAWRNRGISLALAVGVVGVARELAPGPEARVELLYAILVSFGYGHLLGATRSLRCPPQAGQRTRAALRASLVASLFAAYTAALGRAPWLGLPLLLLSAWHTAENDLALGGAYRRAGLSLPLPRAAGPHALALGTTSCLVGAFVACGAGAAVGVTLDLGPLGGTTPAPWRELAAGLAPAVALGAPERARAAAGLAAAAALLPVAWLRDVAFAEAFALLGLYHLLSWCVLLLDRAGLAARSGQVARARALRAELLRLHALPATCCVVLFALPGNPLAGPRALLLAPASYLFWSALHVVQTVGARRRPRRSGCAASPPPGGRARRS